MISTKSRWSFFQPTHPRSEEYCDYNYEEEEEEEEDGEEDGDNDDNGNDGDDGDPLSSPPPSIWWIWLFERK